MIRSKSHFRRSAAKLLHSVAVRTASRANLGRVHNIAFIQAGGHRIDCTLGRSGASHRKREGDGATPRGSFRILNGYYRPDRSGPIKSGIRLSPIRPSDGWCDDPLSGSYNRPKKLPAKESCERMWRPDRLYDIVLVLDYNFTSRSKRLGSAIFFHLWRDPITPTEGCIAISAANMRRLLPRLAPNARLKILL